MDRNSNTMKALLLVIVSARTVAAIAQNTVVLDPVQDAGVGFHDFYPSADNNYESAEHYGGFSQPGYLGGENAGHGLMAFDLSALPGTAQVVSATLDLYGHGPFGTGDVGSVGNIGANECLLERITDAWDEYLVTWNTQPATTTMNSVLLPQSTSATQDYLDIDVTDLVQDMVDDPLNSFGFSIRLVTEDPVRGLVFCSSDFADPAKHPQLTVTFFPQQQQAIPELPGAILSISPNPVQAGGTVHIQSERAGSIGSIEIIDTEGRILAAQRPLAHAPLEIAVPRDIRGTFSLLVRDDHGQLIGSGAVVVQ